MIGPRVVRRVAVLSAAAQATHEAYPWMNLDEDGDGLACECLYYGYQCWTPWG